VPPGAIDFCCQGCAAVHALLAQSGLQRFYALAEGSIAPAAAPEPARPMAWLEPMLERAASAPSCSLELDVQGVHCAGCVWLMEELYTRGGGARGGLLVNPGLGRVRLAWSKGRFDVPAFLRQVEAFGYRFGPALKVDRADPLTWRLGVCAAIAINVMLFSVSFYFGLAPKDGELFRLFSVLSFALSTVAVAVGGWPFFSAAWRGLRAGVLHLDLPIALGIALVYLASLGQLGLGGAHHAYLDTLNIFITLMLLGRWLQNRLVEKNRRFLLEDGGLEGLLCRRVEGAAVRVVPASSVREGDALLVAPGELVPMDAALDDARGAFSMDWISGEAAPRTLARGETVPAGAFNAGDTARHVTALQRLADSGLVPLLRQPSGAGLAPDAFWNRLARRWAAKVLAVSALGFVLWLPAGLERAMDVAAALLVVTCPCALGLSIPLAYERVQSRLRRLGFYARSSDLLDRLREVTKVLFDKTGTLTLGRLALENPEQLLALPVEALQAAYNLACRSAHPKSACLAAALARAGATFVPALEVREVRGCGMEAEFDGQRWRLGAAAWATAEQGDALALGCDGNAVARFSVREELRPQAREQVQALAAAGYQSFLLSGDDAARAKALAARVGIAEANAKGALVPDAKAALVRALDARDTLYLGDGVNDAPAFAAALVSGTPAIDRPVMPSRSAFFFLGESLAPLTAALALAQRLHQVVRRLLAFSLAYNVLAVAAALAGLVTPLVAAVFMPLSSLSLLAYTAFALRDRAAASEPLPSLPQPLPRPAEVTP
jgi:P-type Cu2+ transporter